MNLKKHVLLIMICILTAAHTSAQRDHIDNSNYILCINSYAESSPWSNRMLSTVTEYIQKIPDMALYAEHMNMLMIDNDTIMDEFRKMIAQKYGQHRPKLIVLLGCPAFTLADDYRKNWGDIPIVLCSEENYLGPQSAYICKEPIPPAKRTPLSQLSDPYNMVMVYSDLYIHENIKLISHIIPNMKKFVYIGDQRQINQTNSMDIEDELNKIHPDVEYQFLT